MNINKLDSTLLKSGENLFSSKHQIIFIVLALALVIFFTMPANAEEQHAIGEISQQNLIENYDAFANNYLDYQPTENERVAVKALADKVHVKVYFATWCHDSEREVPRLLQSFKQGATPISLIALDFKKSEPNGSAKQAKVKFTPTFIVYADDVEIGRIIERPELTLAEDIWMLWYRYSATKT